jgi:hypothetical protein
MAAVVDRTLQDEQPTSHMRVVDPQYGGNYDQGMPIYENRNSHCLSVGDVAR